MRYNPKPTSNIESEKSRSGSEGIDTDSASNIDLPKIHIVEGAAGKESNTEHEIKTPAKIPLYPIFIESEKSRSGSEVMDIDSASGSAKTPAKIPLYPIFL